MEDSRNSQGRRRKEVKKVEGNLMSECQDGQANNGGLDGEETHRVLEVLQRLQAL